MPPAISSASIAQASRAISLSSSAEGGELGYALSHAFGAAFDNPDLSFLAFGAYIAWIQIAITVMVLITALFVARVTVREIFRGTWLFMIACTSFFIIQTFTLPGTTEIFEIFGKPIYVESAVVAWYSALAFGLVHSFYVFAP